KRDREEQPLPVVEVPVRVVVVAGVGEQLPVDGDVVEGESALNAARTPGPSVPTAQHSRDQVAAGPGDEEGWLEVQVTAGAAANALSRIVEMVEDAQSNKTEREQFVERFSAWYTPVVVAFAVLVTLGSPFVLGTTWSTAVVHGLTLLVLA